MQVSLRRCEVCRSARAIFSPASLFSVAYIALRLLSCKGILVFQNSYMFVSSQAKINYSDALLFVKRLRSLRLKSLRLKSLSGKLSDSALLHVINMLQSLRLKSLNLKTLIGIMS